MKISKAGLDLVKHFEGCQLLAYIDPVGIWTIGYGHTKGVYRGMRISQAQADKWLAEDLASHMQHPMTVIKTTLNQNQYDALASFCFNLGAYILDGSALLRYINNRDWTKVANEMQLYCNGTINGVLTPLPGLVRRRRAEGDLLLKHIQGGSNGGNSSNKPNTQEGGIVLKTLVLNSPTNLRSTPAINNSNIITTLKKGEVVKFDDITQAAGYIWGIQKRSNNTKGYVALGNYLSHVTIK